MPQWAASCHGQLPRVAVDDLRSHSWRPCALNHVGGFKALNGGPKAVVGGLMPRSYVAADYSLVAVVGGHKAAYCGLRPPTAALRPPTVARGRQLWLEVAHRGTRPPFADLWLPTRARSHRPQLEAAHCGFGGR